MKTLVLPLLVIGFTASTAFAATELEQRIQKGNEFVQKKEYKKAAAEYEGAVQTDPKNAKANLLLGLTYANIGELEKAIRYSQASISAEPTYAAYHNLGLIFANQGNYEKAVEAYTKALEFSPASYRTWYQLGLAHSANGNFKKAIESYNKAVGANPKMAEAYLGLGSAYYWSGEPVLAREQARQLRGIKMKEKARQLEEWIDKNDEKKKAIDAKIVPPAPQETTTAEEPEN
jgi:tetratricopeptide (TPR) repeat protein